MLKGGCSEKLKSASPFIWAPIFQRRGGPILIAAAIKLWRQLFSARRKSKNKEIIAENIICCRQYFSASWRARKISRPLGAEELINCGFYFGPYFFCFSFLCFSFGPKSKADFSFFFCRPYICFYRFIFSGSGRKIKATANGPAIIILKMNGGCFIFSVSGKNKMANIRRLLFWAEAKVREIKRQWPKIIRYTPPINIFIYFSWPQRSAGNGKIKATPAMMKNKSALIIWPAINFPAAFIFGPNKRQRAKIIGRK